MIVNRISGCDSATLKNTGKTGCGRKEGQLLKLFLSLPDTKIAIDPDTGKILEASFQEAIQAKTLFPVRNADSSEDAGTEDQFFESATGESVLMRDGIDGVRAFISASAQEYISLLSFDARTLRVWELDQNGNLTFVDIDGDGSYAAGRLTDQFYIQKEHVQPMQQLQNKLQYS